MNNFNFRSFQKSTKTMLPILSLRKICTTSPRLTEEEYDDLIIMQSTGLFDKNGKEIFEGDYIKIYDKYSEDWFVTRDEDGAWIIEWKSEWDRLAYNTKDFIEIIWNIHENPELLNK